MSTKKTPAQLLQAAAHRYNTRGLIISLLKEDRTKLQAQLKYLHKLQRRDRAKIKEYSK